MWTTARRKSSRCTSARRHSTYTTFTTTAAQGWLPASTNGLPFMAQTQRLHSCLLHWCCASVTEAHPPDQALLGAQPTLSRVSYSTAPTPHSECSLCIPHTESMACCRWRCSTATLTTLCCCWRSWSLPGRVSKVNDEAGTAHVRQQGWASQRAPCRVVREPHCQRLPRALPDATGSTAALPCQHRQVSPPSEDQQSKRALAMFPSNSSCQMYRATTNG